MAGVLDVSGWELRPWDSTFFGVRIGQIAGNRTTQQELSAAVERARRASVDCLYFLADASDDETLRAADASGFRLMDVRMTLECALHRAAPRAPEPRAAHEFIRPARHEDLPNLKALARISHRNTRFHADARFDVGRADELYAVWIERSVAGELAEAVHVVDVGGEARGYITLSAGKDSAAIGLVAVDAAYRGRGFGDRLLRSVLDWTAARGLDRVSVVTQGRSAASIRFYERAGFTTTLVQFWYHVWLA